MVTFDFIKFSFSGNPLAYGTAEAGEMITVPGRGEAMHPWGILRGGLLVLDIFWDGEVRSGP